MFLTFTAPAPSILYLPSSRNLSQVPRWLGNAAIAFAMFTGSFPASLSAQQAAPTHQTGHRIAVVDVAYVMKNLPAIKAHLTKVKADAKKKELRLQQQRDTLKQAAEQLRELKVGSAEYARQEEHVAKLESQGRLHRVDKHGALSETEARLYYYGYRQIVAASRVIATNRNIHLVLNFNGEEMDLMQNDTVVRGVMKHIVYHDSTADITGDVMRYLDQQANAPPTATSDGALLNIRD